MSRIGNELFPLRWNSDLLRPILRSENCLGRIRAACGGSDLRFISGYVSLKRPRSPALAWHQDWWCWDHPISLGVSAAQIAVICYVDTVDVLSGALRVLPGSHRRWTDLHGLLPEAHSSEARQLNETHPAMLPAAGEITLEARPGDAVLLDYRLLHGTHANQAQRRRDALLLSFVPNWTALPPEMREHLALHPALPAVDEGAKCDWSNATMLFPAFAGAARSLMLNRAPRPGFAARRSNSGGETAMQQRGQPQIWKGQIIAGHQREL